MGFATLNPSYASSSVYRPDPTSTSEIAGT